MIESHFTNQIISSAIEVHRALGPGLLEDQGINLQRQAELPLVYKDIKFDAGYRIDLFVEKRVIVEVKSVDSLNDIHTAHVLTYLKLTNCRVGLLINFNMSWLKQGIKRLIY